MYIQKEITDLKEFKPWGGAKYVYDKIIKQGLGEEFIKALEGALDPKVINEEELNDLLWHEADTCYGLVGLLDED